MFQTHFAKPGTKIISLGIIAVAVVAATILFKSSSKQDADQEKNIGTVTTVVRDTMTEVDSDGDGLKDWEEPLWGMDPKNSDSDGDGVGDLAQVAQEKDEAQAVRDQTISAATSSLFSFFEENKNLTRTDALSHALFEQVITFKNAGIPLTAEDATQIASTLGDALVTAPKLNEKPWTLGDIQILTDPTNEQIHTYGNAVAGALKVKTSEQNNEFIALAEFMETGSVASLSKLDPVIQHYRDVVIKLRAIPTPKEISGTHITLINALQTTATILERLRNLSDDSVSALPVLQKYQATYETSVAQLHAMKGYLVKHSIQYSDLEDGSLIVTMY